MCPLQGLIALFLTCTAMVQLFHEGDVRVADGQAGSAAACLPTQNSHQDCQGKKKKKNALCEEAFVGNSIDAN